MTRKTRPCVDGPGCVFPAQPGLRRCGWHWLLKQPIAVQLEKADARLAKTPPSARRARVPQSLWPANGRWCAGCQSFVPMFYTRGSRCVACASRATHSARIEKTYGITEAEYNRLLLLQGGRCGICRKLPRAKRLAVDHDHRTGVVRGLLCKRCNHDLLGAAEDSVEILERAVAYLQAPPTSGAWHVAAAPARDDGPAPY